MIELNENLGKQLRVENKREAERRAKEIFEENIKKIDGNKKIIQILQHEMKGSKQVELNPFDLSNEGFRPDGLNNLDIPDPNSAYQTLLNQYLEEVANKLGFEFKIKNNGKYVYYIFYINKPKRLKVESNTTSFPFE